MSAALRREDLVTLPSPDPRHDYLVELRAAAGPVALRVRYVPDRLILDPASLARHTEGLTGGLEAVALALLDDLANELVPRWLEVTASAETPLPHRVVAEDRQPAWDNPTLLARLERI
ncbi:hypothetical protein [Azospirillum oleiclasticum]|uniref:hypothetical protein n=1 Tax=Azospirillum oleiclasticum TaxID=2735135 RepID=UPI0031B5E685